MPGHVIYSGSSNLDGGPIVCIAVTESTNRKTGDMVQTYVLRADINPLEASRIGADRSVCGHCPHRGKADPTKPSGVAEGRSCYVSLTHGPAAVYRAYSRGRYALVHSADDITAIGRGRMVRVGTYGDPAAVPDSVWDALLKDASGMTGYTHARGHTYKRLMVSVDTLSEARDAWSAGRRTFRVIPVAEWQSLGVKALQKGEVLCPASKEAGYKVQCQTCGLCDGARRGRSVAIVAHGLGRKRVGWGRV